MRPRDIQAIADATTEALGIEPVRFLGWSKRRGWAHLERRTFSLPAWVREEREEYIIAYAVHEVCHHAPGTFSHGLRFTRVEDNALGFWGLQPAARGRRPSRYVIRLAGPDGELIPPTPGGVYAGKS